MKNYCLQGKQQTPAGVKSKEVAIGRLHVQLDLRTRIPEYAIPASPLTYTNREVVKQKIGQIWESVPKGPRARFIQILLIYKMVTDKFGRRFKFQRKSDNNPSALKIALGQSLGPRGAKSLLLGNLLVLGGSISQFIPLLGSVRIQYSRRVWFVYVRIKPSSPCNM